MISVILRGRAFAAESEQQLGRHLEAPGSGTIGGMMPVAGLSICRAADHLLSFFLEDPVSAWKIHAPPESREPRAIAANTTAVVTPDYTPR